MALLDANDQREDADEPGPGHYFGPGSLGFSSLGKQLKANCRSAPEIPIPSTGWDNWRRVTISKGHVADLRGLDAPGAGTYDHHGTLGGRTTTMGSSKRADLSKSMGVDPYGAPGPNAYTLPSPFEQDVKKLAKTGPKGKGFGTAQRFQELRLGRSEVGPGQYFRKDAAIKLGTGRSFSVGHRAYDKVRQPHVEGQKGVESKGPGPPLWQDIVNDGSRANSIPKERRFRTVDGNGAPGPGAYDREERDVAKMHSICSDMPNPGGCKFGKPPKKPRLRANNVIFRQEKDSHGCWGYF